MTVSLSAKWLRAPGPHAGRSELVEVQILEGRQYVQTQESPVQLVDGLRETVFPHPQHAYSYTRTTPECP
ncbi:hypothetical protein ABZY10_24235 [Streptomyces sp. NPDC006539]|uniref:hypothetical protein n=1 Tax=Streptomyces sp. NPDC006539 TaxID=3155352 RepID=UPI0033B560DF